MIGTLTDVLDTANLIIDGQIVRLAGIAQSNEAYIVRAMQDNLTGLELVVRGVPAGRSIGLFLSRL